MKKDLKTINDILYRSLARLDDDDIMKKDAEIEIKRSNAISTTSKQIISTIKTKLEITRLKDNGSKNIKNIERGLGIDIE